jgi:hypothetical protein
MDVAVEPLNNYPETVPVVAEWHFREWGHTDPGGSLEAYASGSKNGESYVSSLNHTGSGSQPSAPGMSARILQSSIISGSSSVLSAVTMRMPAGTAASARVTGIWYSFSRRCAANAALLSAASMAPLWASAVA